MSFNHAYKPAITKNVKISATIIYHHLFTFRLVLWCLTFSFSLLILFFSFLVSFSISFISLLIWLSVSMILTFWTLCSLCRTITFLMNSTSFHVLGKTLPSFSFIVFSHKKALQSCLESLLTCKIYNDNFIISWGAERPSDA